LFMIVTIVYINQQALMSRVDSYYMDLEVVVCI